jgi:Pyridoxamine 5'-phosphate oxidase
MSAWPDTIDEVLGSDLAVALAYVTPASGVVVAPVTNLGLRDREAGTLTVTSSLGLWKKLDRIRRDPRVAVAFHTREHGFSDRPEYVLVQGTASFSPRPDRAWLESIRENWERFLGPRDFGPLWDRWLHAYTWERVAVEIAVERLIVWPDLACRGAREVHGAPLPAQPPPVQRRPARGTGPRVNHARAAAKARRLPNLLLGWVGTDGFPIVAPVEVNRTDVHGIVLEAPEGLVPAGGRRAGLTAHWFSPRVTGQDQRIHTGWLEAASDRRRILYAPHTQAGYRLPPSKLLYRLAAGFVTRRGIRQARRAGFLPAFASAPGHPSSRTDAG